MKSCIFVINLDTCSQVQKKKRFFSNLRNQMEQLFLLEIKMTSTERFFFRYFSSRALDVILRHLLEPTRTHAISWNTRFQPAERMVANLRTRVDIYEKSAERK